MRSRFFVLVGLSLLATAGFGQKLLITAVGHDGTPAKLVADDLSVEVDHHPATVRDLVPLRGDRAGLQLYIVIDDGTSTELGLQFKDLKAFIDAQPSTTQIGLVYLRNGSAVIAAPLSSDRAQFMKELRIPLGEPGISASPYMGISDLVKKWPPTEVRREILFIGSGIDPYSPHDPQNLYLQNAMADAERAGIPVNSIYFGEAGGIGHSSWNASWGQNYLSEIGEATGGKAYWEGNINPVSIESFLNNFSMRLENQYLLALDGSGIKPGLQQVHVTTPRAGVSIAAASKIYLRR